jgi:hypothetical protein
MNTMSCPASDGPAGNPNDTQRLLALLLHQLFSSHTRWQVHIEAQYVEGQLLLRRLDVPGQEEIALLIDTSQRASCFRYQGLDATQPLLSTTQQPLLEVMRAFFEPA